MKRTFAGFVLLITATIILISCGSSSSSGSGSRPSKLRSRAFVSNPLNPSGVGGSFNPILNIVDASLDTLSRFSVSVSSGPGLLTLSPSGLLTVVYSPSNHTISVVDNDKEAIAAVPNTTTSAPTVTLPGATESIVVGHDNFTGFAAIPTVTVNGAPPTPGAVVAFGLFSGSVAATIPVPGARTIVQSHNGNRILAFGDNSNTVTIITPSSIGTSMDPRTPVCCFDHPVWGIFSADDTTAYIFNCGPECGGIAAGITVLDINTGSVGATLPLPGSTYGILSGSTLYVAGTPPGTPCGAGTAATACGTLSLVNIGAMTASAPVIITDGYHNRMEMSTNGHLFIGAKTCTNLNGSTETRGCLSIYNTTAPAVVFPPDTGDVTGLQAIPGRNVLYVCQGGVFRIYDTTTDKLLVPLHNQEIIDIVGQSVDVKFVN